MKKISGVKWYSIIAPSYFGNIKLGETFSSEPEKLIGRKLIANVVDLTEDASKFYMKIGFRINEVKEDKAFTEFDSFECMRDYLARMVVHRVRRIDSAQELKTRDGITLRVKTLATTSKKARSTTEKAIRAKIEDMIKNFVESLTLEDFLKKVIGGELKSEIIKEGRKIYPLRNFEFRRIERK